MSSRGPASTVRNYKLHRKYVETLYRDQMAPLMNSSTATDLTTLGHHHTKSFLYSLRILSQVEPLTEELRKEISKHLEKLYKGLRKLNEEKREISIQKNRVIALDVGYSYSRVAINRSGEAKLVENGNGKEETPSWIYFDEFSSIQNEGPPEYSVGTSAIQASVNFPGSSIFGMKAMIECQGRRTKNKPWPFLLIPGKDSVAVRIGNVEFSGPTLIQMVVEHLLKHTKEHLPEKVTFAILTVPAKFTHNERELMREACVLAGLNVLQIVNEPTAALLAYYLSMGNNNNYENKKNKPPFKNYVVVFDLGGRKLDVTVFEMLSDNQILIRGRIEEPTGGDAFDEVMAQHCIKQFEKKHSKSLKSKLHKDERFMKNYRKLKIVCEQEKRSLSHSLEVKVNVCSFHECLDLIVPVSRKKFESLNSDHFNIILEKVDEVVKDKAGLNPTEVTHVILAGGSSNIPRINAELRSYFKDSQILDSIPPSEVVVRGAALLAQRNGLNPEIINVNVQDPVIPLTPESILMRSPNAMLYDPSTPTFFRVS